MIRVPRATVPEVVLRVSTVALLPLPNAVGVGAATNCCSSCRQLSGVGVPPLSVPPRLPVPVIAPPMTAPTVLPMPRSLGMAVVIDHAVNVKVSPPFCPRSATKALSTIAN